jgi:regulatory protein
MSGKITALEVQKRNKERVNVYLDGDYAFSVDLMSAARLRKGQVLSTAEVASLRDEDVVSKAFERSIRYLATRPRTVQEIRRKLKQKETPDNAIEIVIARLEDHGYVNDAEFARLWIRNRSEFSPRGPMSLRSELRSKGVSQAIIDEVLTDLGTTELAMQAARQKVSSLRGLDQFTFRKKLSSFLGRRGFKYDTIREVIDVLIDELENNPEMDHSEIFFQDPMDDIIEE